ncbi:amino acid permease [Paenibacillus sp. GD4]|uniref:amino acid permease n=1 Tax=Paenibacillus sp. GD4 TaxID=3068890 RepID=UPI002796CF66|nr:amino acid permease [Paenibacillus sp. GD4]MDQ1912847.1 amino acid permease [Paenibacillus sp. GD4]
MEKTNGSAKEQKMKWWQLSLLGVACTIGTGYFLGSGIAIETGGPAVLAAFILAAFGTYMVFDVLARMTAEEPLKGSFRSYAKKAYGRWAGFSSGWVYWSSELLIMGSQMTALSLFSRFWFPNVPMWLLASVYAVLGLIVILTGHKGFERTEHVFAVMKIAAILIFILIAAIGLLGWLPGGSRAPSVPVTREQLLPNGAIGLWSAFLFAFYAFGGIEIMGLMATRLKEPKEAPKAGKIMILLLTVVYLISLSLAIVLVTMDQFNDKESPFLLALNNWNLPFVPHLFNGVFIIAGFSTMVASLFAVTTILVTLAGDGDAPPVFAKEYKRKLPLPAIGLTTVGLMVSILMALLLPDRLYHYVTTAAGLMLLYNWLFILVTSGKLLTLTGWGQTKRFAGMALILGAVSGSLFHDDTRPGFMISLGFIIVIGVLTLVMRYVWKKKKKAGASSPEKEHFTRFEPKVQAEADERQAGKYGNQGKEPSR